MKVFDELPLGFAPIAPVAQDLAGEVEQGDTVFGFCEVDEVIGIDDQFTPCRCCFLQSLQYVTSPGT